MHSNKLVTPEMPQILITGWSLDENIVNKGSEAVTVASLNRQMKNFKMCFVFSMYNVDTVQNVIEISDIKALLKFI